VWKAEVFSSLGTEGGVKVFLRFESGEGKKLSSTIIFLEFSRNFSAFDASSKFRVFFRLLLRGLGGDLGGVAYFLTSAARLNKFSNTTDINEGKKVAFFDDYILSLRDFVAALTRRYERLLF